MGDDTVAKLARSLGRYQAMVVGGLCFIILFAITIMGVMLYLSFTLGSQSQRLENIATETHNVLCAQFTKEVVANRDARALLRGSPQGLLDRRGNIVIEASLIQRGIDQRQDTIDAMKGAGLTC